MSRTGATGANAVMLSHAPTSPSIATLIGCLRVGRHCPIQVDPEEPEPRFKREGNVTSSPHVVGRPVLNGRFVAMPCLFSSGTNRIVIAVGVLGPNDHTGPMSRSGARRWRHGPAQPYDRHRRQRS